MSYSGAGLYDDDAGSDVRAEYRELVADGQSGEAATNTLLARWGDALEDHDEACAFWLALADTQWRVGRLEDRVRDRAMQIIASGEDLRRFDHSSSLHKRRSHVLDDLVARLASPQRPPLKIRRPFRSVSPVGVGDVFAYEVSGSLSIYLRVVAMEGGERNNQPKVEVLDWSGPERPNDPATLRARPSGRGTDVLWLVRYPRDPDPAERIVVLAKGTPITRRETFGATLVAWTDLRGAVERRWGPLVELKPAEGPVTALDADFDRILHELDRATAIREVLADRMAAGRTHEALIKEIVATMLAFRAAGQDREESLMLEALDILLTDLRSPTKR